MRTIACTATPTTASPSTPAKSPVEAGVEPLDVDVVEQLAIDRVKQLFGAEHANVQANSGSQANQPVRTSWLWKTPKAG